MLLAGAVTCVIGIAQHMETLAFMKTLLAVLIIFYVIGCIAQMILDKNFKAMDDKTAAEDADADGQKDENAGETAGADGKTKDSDGE